MDISECPVIQINSIKKHPHNQNMEIVNLENNITIVVNKGEFSIGDVAIFFPSFTILPNNIVSIVNIVKCNKQKSILGGKNNNVVIPCNISGVNSQGVLLKCKKTNKGNWFFEEKKRKILFIFNKKPSIVNVNIGSNMSARLGVTKHIIGGR